MASFDEMCTSQHPAALRISVFSCFLVSLSSVPCCFTESADEEPDMSVRILFSWFALLFLKGEEAEHDFFLGLMTLFSTMGCPLVLHTTVCLSFDCSSFIRTKWVKYISSSLVSRACSCFNGRSGFDPESGGRAFCTGLLVFEDSVPMVGVSVSVDDGVCCSGVEVCSSGRVSLSGRQLLSLALF